MAEIIPIIGEGESRTATEAEHPATPSPRELLFVLENAIRERGFVKHCIDSFNEFVERGMRQIITKQFSIETPIVEYKRIQGDGDESIKTVSLKVEFTDAVLLRPEHVTQSLMTMPLKPHEARRSHKTYSGTIEVDADIIYTAKFADGHEHQRTEHIKGFGIGKIPVMVGSVACHTHEMSREELIREGEDPLDPGGIFIVKGIERAIESNESQIYNASHNFARQYLKEVARCNIISKPGDSFENSFQLIITVMQNGAILVEMDIVYLAGLQIPFYVFYRMLGMMSDLELMQTIIHQRCHTISEEVKAPPPRQTDAITATLYKNIRHALHIRDEVSQDGADFESIKYSNNREEIFAFMADVVNRHIKRTVKAKRNTKLMQYNNELLQRVLDEKFLPHCGTSPEARVKKCVYLGHLIRDLLLTKMHAIEGTDRDSVTIKRLHTPGYAFSKEFKKLLNSTFIVPAKSALTELLPGQSFFRADLRTIFMSTVKGQQLEKAMTQSIKAVATIKQEQRSKLSITALERKNMINTFASLRVITTPNKTMAQQSDRAYAMRAVHPTYTGYICPNASVDTGAAVGLNKQLAVATMVSTASSSAMLTNILLDDPLVVAWNKMPIDNILDANEIFVNGDLVGYTTKPADLVGKYRYARRYGGTDTPADVPVGPAVGKGGSTPQGSAPIPLIDRYTTIVWDTYVSRVYHHHGPEHAACIHIEIHT